VEDAVEFEGELERRDEDVEFAIDGVGAVEVEIKIGIEPWEFLGEPAFQFGDSGAFGLVGVVPSSGACVRAKLVS